eukprot:snap_masked-scaffold_12-processed-gene-10.39-mRNA-1 protein AED:1.00 eAED:1.00 QI:0/-1/0/0/-1/1/1/0/239
MEFIREKVLNNFEEDGTLEAVREILRLEAKRALKIENNKEDHNKSTHISFTTQEKVNDLLVFLEEEGFELTKTMLLLEVKRKGFHILKNGKTSDVLKQEESGNSQHEDTVAAAEVNGPQAIEVSFEKQSSQKTNLSGGETEETVKERSLKVVSESINSNQTSLCDSIETASRKDEHSKGCLKSSSFPLCTEKEKNQIEKTEQNKAEQLNNEKIDSKEISEVESIESISESDNYQSNEFE